MISLPASDVGTHPLNAPTFSAAPIDRGGWPDGILDARTIGNDGIPVDFDLRVRVTSGSRIVPNIALYRVVRAIGSIHKVLLCADSDWQSIRRIFPMQTQRQSAQLAGQNPGLPYS